MFLRKGEGMNVISIVIPAYNEAENIQEIYERISKEFSMLKEDFEVIFVDDGSKDETFFRISTLTLNHKNVIGVKFSRNFGKEAAIFAGLHQASGDAAIVMDADMQHPVTLLHDMVDKWQQGYLIVEARKLKRQNESAMYRFFSKLFYKILNRMAGIELNNLSDFKLLDRKAYQMILKLTEKQTFFRALSGWMGYRSCFIDFEVADRLHGQTSWSMKGLFKYAINNITSFSSLPLHLVTVMGFIFFVFAMLLGIHTLYNYFVGDAVSGFTTVILVLLILGAVLMSALGIIGHYLAKIYDELKNRPRYIIEEIKGVNYGED